MVIIAEMNVLAVGMEDRVSEFKGLPIRLLNMIQGKDAIRSFKTDQIGEFSDLSIMQILDALDELVNRHFLFVRSTQYQFVHELIRQAVLDGMSPARRKFLQENFLGD